MCGDAWRIAPDYEIIVVDDGSTDRTGAIAEESPLPIHISASSTTPNRGYGGALIAGFNAMTKPLTFFMDADGQFDIRDLALLLPLREQGHRAVLGYRLQRQDSPLRKLNAWGWKLLVSKLLQLHVRDVDCAFKLYDTSLVRAVDVTAEGAMVNTEMLVKLTGWASPSWRYPCATIPGSTARPAAPTCGSSSMPSAAFRLHSKLRNWRATVPPKSSGLLIRMR